MDSEVEQKPEETKAEVGTQTDSAKKDPAPEPEKKPDEGGKEVKAKRKTSEAILAGRANAAIAAAQPYAHVPFVAMLLAMVHGDLSVFLADLGIPVDRTAELKGRKQERGAAGDALRTAFVPFRRVISTTAAGRELIEKSKAKDNATWARQLIAGMTPAVLRNCQPLMDDLVEALANYDIAQRTFAKYEGQAESAKSKADAMADRLRSSVGALIHVTHAAEWLEARDQASAGSSGAPPAPPQAAGNDGPDAKPGAQSVAA